MSLSLLSSSALTVTSESKPTTTARQPPSTALDFLAAALLPELEFFTWTALRIFRDHSQAAGSGGFSSVQIGELRDSGILVAVKRSRALHSAFLSADKGLFEKDFVQITLELRILSHCRLKTHPNILNVLGICLDEYHEAPSLALVLEYSQIGTLRTFLGSDDGHLSLEQHIDLIAQVSQGLAAVHSFKIAHGDVKTENVLVFSDKDFYLVKISDFGQSVIAPSYDSSANVNPPAGTALLRAPEIRTGKAFYQSSFTIDDAILSDIFSFGLLAWEVLKGGSSFFDLAWIPGNCRMDTPLLEHFLDDLPPNKLWRYGSQFLKTLLEGTFNYSHLDQLMEACLQDDPRQRKPMAEVVKILKLGTDPQRCV